MSQHARIVLSLLVALFVPSVAVPSFDIDLDQPPEKRWAKVVDHYRPEMVAMAKALRPLLDKSLGKDKADWLKYGKIDPEYTAELKGMVDAINDTDANLEQATLINMLYEIASPTACSAVLVAMTNGTVLHGRNMDYGFHFKMPDGSVRNWPNVTFDATFHKAGKRLFKTTTWPWFVGVHTGMRFGGWGFQQNTRSALNEKKGNLDAAKKGGQPFGTFVRKAMETTPDFNSAVNLLYNGKLMAPQYFVLSGTEPYQGSVLTIDRLGKHATSSPPVTNVTKKENGWHLVQTNDDLGSVPKPPDFRRPIAEAMLSKDSQDVATVDNLSQFMHTVPLYWNETVFSTLMVPQTGYYQTLLPDDPPKIKGARFLKMPALLAEATTRALTKADDATEEVGPLPRKYRQQGFLSPRS